MKLNLWTCRQSWALAVGLILSSLIHSWSFVISYLLNKGRHWKVWRWIISFSASHFVNILHGLQHLLLLPLFKNTSSVLPLHGQVEWGEGGRCINFLILEENRDVQDFLVSSCLPSSSSVSFFPDFIQISPNMSDVSEEGVSITRSSCWLLLSKSRSSIFHLGPTFIK